MDDLVKQALARWPDVPDCTGWLELDARGRWRIGEAKDGPRKPITHAAMLAFINRNYTSVGRTWFFQNGPQRVFVELEYTPYVWRLHPRAADAWELIAQTGASMTPSSAWLDDEGRFLFEARSAAGEPLIGVVHDHDTALVAELLRDGDGEALDDDAMTYLASARFADASVTAAPDASAIGLHWKSCSGEAVLLPLQRIESDRVAAQFGFEPSPSLALRVDVDTRR